MKYKMQQSEFNDMVQMHHLWREGDPYGSRADFSNTILEGIDASDRNLRHTTFFNSELTDVNFANSMLNHANMTAVKIERCDFTNAQLPYARFSPGNLINPILGQNNLRGIYGDGIHIKSMMLDMQQISWTDTVMQINCTQHPIDYWFSSSVDQLLITIPEHGDQDYNTMISTWWAKWRLLVEKIILKS